MVQLGAELLAGPEIRAAMRAAVRTAMRAAMPLQRSLRVPSAISANTRLTSQKRTMIFGSSQPLSS